MKNCWAAQKKSVNTNGKQKKSTFTDEHTRIRIVHCIHYIVFLAYILCLRCCLFFSSLLSPCIFAYCWRWHFFSSHCTRNNLYILYRTTALECQEMERKQCMMFVDCVYLMLCVWLINSLSAAHQDTEIVVCWTHANSCSVCWCVRVRGNVLSTNHLKIRITSNKAKHT